jgi:hypothetical protein
MRAAGVFGWHRGGHDVAERAGVIVWAGRLSRRWLGAALDDLDQFRAVVAVLACEADQLARAGGDRSLLGGGCDGDSAAAAELE